MKKQLIAVIVACVLAFGMFGCSKAASNNSESRDNNNATQNAQSSTPQDLVVADSGYVISNGYVHYALEVQNPNTNFAASFANVTVTGKHADGSIGFSDEWVVSNIMPGSTTYWASQAGDGDTIETDTIDIKVSVNDNNWDRTDQTLPVDLYTFDNVSVAPAQYMGLKAKGEITLTEDYSVDYTDGKSPMLVCILKDANGSIVSGFSGYMSSDLTVGSPSVFDITSYFDVANYATAEMYANMWM